MQQFAEIIIGMTVEEVLALVPDPLLPGKVTLAVTDPDSGDEEKRHGLLVDFEFEASEGETRENFAERVHMACCDFIYDEDGVAEPEPSPEALQQLSESGPFQALFQFQFEEAVNRGRSPGFDICFSNPVRFAFAPPVLRHLKGRFTGDVDLLGDGAGETSGTFRFELPRAIDSGPPEAVLDGAILNLKIYRFPGIRPAGAA